MSFCVTPCRTYLNVIHIIRTVLLYLSIKQQHRIATVPVERKGIKIIRCYDTV